MAATKVGFIGLGRMGLPMSYRLLAAGFDLTVHNRSQSKVQEIASDGARAATSVAEVVRVADVVLACLPDVATSEEIFLGVETPAADLAYRVVKQAVDKGLGDMDSAATVMLLEEQAGCVVERKPA